MDSERERPKWFRLIHVRPDLTVPLELEKNPDGTQTVHLREGILLGEPLAELINELAWQRQTGSCTVCTLRAISAAGIPVQADEVMSLKQARPTAGYGQYSGAAAENSVDPSVQLATCDSRGNDS
ncbi:hypothetical protein ACQPW3_13345 [Actinosynnema sp. CA-248983]